MEEMANKRDGVEDRTTAYDEMGITERVQTITMQRWKTL